jgi:hypothetical protein
MVGVFLGGMMVDHNAGAGDCSIAWSVANVSVRRGKNGVGAFGDDSTSLCQAMKFFAHCLEPQISEHGNFDQLPIMGDSFFGDEVHYSVAVFFDFNNWACVLLVDKFARD